jgi:hypothetical protein
MLSTNSRAARPSSGRSARNQTTHGLAPRALLAGSVAFALIACAPAANNSGGTGGKSSSGGNNSGGSNSGGSNNGGSAQGGSNSGGSAQGGSANNGGSAQGGSANNGGSAQGGSANNGGSAQGGSANSGGSAKGGSNSGGSAAGGSGAGGSSSGGSSAQGGSSNGGSAAGGSTNTGANPPGYYMTKDWNVTTADWHGCVWTGVDSTVTGSTTSITPQDFTTGTTEGGPYHVSGTVFNDYNAVAMIGFNLNEAPTGNNTQCVYNKAAALAAGPPVAAIPSSAKGIAVNWSAAKAPPTSFRIQIQGTDGATNPAHRWCATITDAAGPSFVPFTGFYTQCWGLTSVPPAPGAQYAGEPIDAVVFLVPGTVAQKAPFDFTIVGFAPGTSSADAPGKAAACGTMTGTLGSTTASEAASMQRASVTGTDCKKYIIQNNNWGNKTGSTEVINYTGTGFTVQSSSGTSTGVGVPASFPSTYVGANGDLANGSYNTWADTGLPKQISAMASAQTSFGWSGGTGGKNFNASYDVWFAKTPPTAGSYQDAISGFIMVWLYKPANNQPIGSIARTATIAGHTWNVWVGPRNTTAVGTDGTGRPVISYVAQDSPVASLSFNLKDFISDAVTKADTASGITQSFSSSWYLTDVFAGFEIWSGGDASNLQSTGFTCVVK